jgi:hypothetical protein
MFSPRRRTCVTRVTATCNKGNNAQTTIDFKFSFCPDPFSGLLLCSGLLSFLLLQAADLAVVEGVLEAKATGGAARERDNGGSESA